MSSRSTHAPEAGLHHNEAARFRRKLGEVLISFLVSVFALVLGGGAMPAIAGSAPVQAGNAASNKALTSAHTFTFRLSADPTTLDWNLADTPVETDLMVNLMEGLVGMDEHLRPVPALAESWQITDGGTTYTFKLRPGVKWSDGVPLKAQDFVYGWKRLLSPLTAAPYAYLLFDVQGAEAYNQGKLDDFSKVGVRALNDQTLQVKLAHPVAYWLYIPTFWATFPLREDVVRKYGSDWDLPGRMVTVGPFTLDSHDLDSRIVLRANPLYYGAHGNIDQVVAKIVQEDSDAVSQFEAGKLDFTAGIPGKDLVTLAGKPELKSFPSLKTSYLGFVVNKYPISNVKLRRAIAMAIDKTKLTQLLHGGETPAESWVPSPLLGSSKAVGLPFNVEKAKKELDASGIDASQPVSVGLIFANWDKSLTLAQFIQSQLKKNLGLSVHLQPFDIKTFRAQLALRAYPGFLSSWSAEYPDPDSFASVFLSESGNNRTEWKNSKYDQLVLAARTAQNTQEREKKYSEAQKILLEEDTVIVPLYYEPNSALIQSRVKGLELNPLNYLFLKKVNLD